MFEFIYDIRQKKFIPGISRILFDLTTIKKTMQRQSIHVDKTKEIQYAQNFDKANELKNRIWWYHKHEHTFIVHFDFARNVIL